MCSILAGMSRHLIVNGGAENWRLPDSSDLSELRVAVQTAIVSGEVMQLSVVPANGEAGPVDLLLNCRAATSVILIDT